jgi:hypothetical protein
VNDASQAIKRRYYCAIVWSSAACSPANTLSQPLQTMHLQHLLNPIDPVVRILIEAAARGRALRKQREVAQRQAAQRQAQGMRDMLKQRDIFQEFKGNVEMMIDDGVFTDPVEGWHGQLSS